MSARNDEHESSSQEEYVIPLLRPKVVEACRNCRSRKAKCEPVSPGQCKRCLQKNIQCVYERGSAPGSPPSASSRSRRTSPPSRSIRGVSTSRSSASARSPVRGSEPRSPNSLHIQMYEISSGRRHVNAYENLSSPVSRRSDEYSFPANPGMGQFPDSRNSDIGLSSSPPSQVIYPAGHQVYRTAQPQSFQQYPTENQHSFTHENYGHPSSPYGSHYDPSSPVSTSPTASSNFPPMVGQWPLSPTEYDISTQYHQSTSPNVSSPASYTPTVPTQYAPYPVPNSASWPASNNYDPCINQYPDATWSTRTGYGPVIEAQTGNAVYYENQNTQESNPEGSGSYHS